MRALIVDDDPHFRKLLELRLRVWKPGIEIQSADSLRSAREVLDVDPLPFTLVILDQHLPDGTGPEMFHHPKLSESAVLAMSADDTADVPAKAVVAGAEHFLSKVQLNDPMFVPLLEAIITRKELEKNIRISELRQQKLDTIRALVATLRHEINNPLGAVMGGTFLLRSSGALSTEQNEALQLIEQSGSRIKHVLQELCDAADIEQVTKGNEELFHIPGDKPWDKGKLT